MKNSLKSSLPFRPDSPNIYTGEATSQGNDIESNYMEVNKVKNSGVINTRLAGGDVDFDPEDRK